MPAAGERGIEMTLGASESLPTPIAEDSPNGVVKPGKKPKDLREFGPKEEEPYYGNPENISEYIEKDYLEFKERKAVKSPIPNYPLAEETWEKHFVSDAAEIPVNAFRAFYFNDKNPKDVVHTEMVDHPGFNYADPNGAYGIDPYDFGAYYIGYLDFSEPASREINVDLSWADCRVIIDGKVVYASKEVPGTRAPGVYSHDSSGSSLFEFSPGRHKVEIEFVNNWHTIGFNVAFLEPYVAYTHEELISELKKTQNAEYWYAGVYESEDVGNDIHVTLKPSQKPVFLFLSSFNAVDWVFSDIKETNLKAVILPTGRSRGAVAGLPEQVAVYHLHDMPWTYKMMPECSMGQCDDAGFQNLIPFVLKLKPNFFTGFSSAYGAKELMIPSEVLDMQDYERIAKELLELQKKAEEEDPYDDRTTDVIF